MLAPWKESYDKSRQCIRKQRHYCAKKGPYTQSYVFFPVVMYRCECWYIKKADRWKIDNFEITMLKKTLENLLGSKEIKSDNPKGNQLWIFTERTDTEVPILWPSDAKHRLLKELDAGNDWGQEDKEETEDELVGWHHLHNAHDFEQTLGDG